VTKKKNLPMKRIDLGISAQKKKKGTRALGGREKKKKRGGGGVEARSVAANILLQGEKGILNRRKRVLNVVDPKVRRMLGPDPRYE